jgi:transcriptional regulator with XRE-family HTH domain
MEKLGERIKKLRIEKGIKQSALGNQSAISSIERSNYENPTAEILRTIAENLEMSFDELTKGTDWSAPKIENNEGRFGYSELDFSMTIQKNGKIDIQYKKYPRFDSNGMENRFCPKTSTPLLFNCKNCSKPIQSIDQIFCMGCGKKIFHEPIFETMDELFIEYKIDNTFLEQKKIYRNNNIDDVQDLIDAYVIQQEIEGKINSIKFFEIRSNINWMKEILDTLERSSELIAAYEGYPPSIISGDVFHHGKEDAQRTLEQYFMTFDDLSDQIAPDFVDVDEYIKGLNTKNEQYYNFHLRKHFEMKFISSMALALSKLIEEEKFEKLNQEEE